MKSSNIQAQNVNGIEPKEPRPGISAMKLPAPAFDGAFVEGGTRLGFEEAILRAIQDRTETSQPATLE
jgi:hypothetical protein